MKDKKDLRTFALNAARLEGERLLISPKSKASRRTCNRIAEHGTNGFVMERTDETLSGEQWLLRASDGWLGWLPRDEFHLECVGEKFFVKKF